MQQIQKIFSQNISKINQIKSGAFSPQQPSYYFCAPKAKKLDKSQELLLQKLKEKKERYATTKDKFRIDVGFIVERLPIFDTVDAKDLENLKFVRSIQNKYKTKLDIPKELLEFDEKHPTEEFDRHDTDNLITHQDLENKHMYHKYSKLFKNTDPTMESDKSIQYASSNSVFLLVKQNGTWGFPTSVVYERQSLNECLSHLTNSIENKIFSTYPIYLVPMACEVREFSEEEAQQDNKNRGLIGAKCFYYQGLHVSGNVERALQGQYEEFSWVPKMHLQNFLNENQYNSIAPALN